MTETSAGEDVVAGEIRRPRNVHLAAAGSIHDDETARNLGFRGGTIAGSYHLEQAVPLLLSQFGPGWFESGTLAAYFRRATVDGEAVRVFATRPADTGGAAPISVWMDTADGHRVFDGATSAGPEGAGALADRMTSRDAGQVRILAGIRVGEVIDLGEKVLDGTRQRARLRGAAMTEPLDWYDEASPWGAAVAAPPTEVWFTFESVKEVLAARRGPGVGLYGAIELRHLGGPLLLGETYRVTSTVRALGCTPKTEYLWTETVASRAGKPVTSVLMMSRIMKASSALYS